MKREVFELNNKFRIESGQDPLPIPQELIPANYMGNFNNNFLNIRDDVSINPSIIDPFRPQSFRVQTAIPPPTPANPAYIESSPPNQPPISVPQPFSPEMSVINQPQLFSPYPVPNYPPPNYPIPNYSSPYPPPQYPSQYPNPYPASYPKFQNTSSLAVKLIITSFNVKV